MSMAASSIEMAHKSGNLQDDDLESHLQEDNDSRVDVLSDARSNKNMIGAGSKDKYEQPPSKEIIRY